MSKIFNFSNVSFGNNNVCINSRTVDKFDISNTKKINKEKTVDAHKVEKISIDSTFIDVHIVPSNSFEIQIKLSGHTDMSSNIEFKARLVNQELKIVSNCLGNSNNCNLVLSVLVPCKTFKSISVTTISGNIKLGQNIFTDNLVLNTISGDLISDAIFSTGSFISKSGDVVLATKAYNNIDIKITTTSGDITTNLNNFIFSSLHCNSIAGEITNHHSSSNTRYNAKISIFSLSGDIFLK